MLALVLFSLHFFHSAAFSFPTPSAGSRALVLSFPANVVYSNFIAAFAQDVYLSVYSYSVYSCFFIKITGEQAYTVIAGFTSSGSCGGSSGDGGLATSASFSTTQRPFCFDLSGNMYLVDGSRLRKVDYSTKIISTVAGGPSAGDSGDGGPGTSATFSSLSIVTVDSLSNVLYLYDSNYYRVRRLNLNTFIISAVTGSGSPFVFVPGTLALDNKLGYLNGMVVDSKGNLLLSTERFSIVRVSPLGIASSFASANNSINPAYNIFGASTSVSTQTSYSGLNDGKLGFYTSFWASGLAIDSMDNLYIRAFTSSGSSNSIQMISNNSNLIVTVAGHGGGNYPSSHTTFVPSCSNNQGIIVGCSSSINSPAYFGELKSVVVNNTLFHLYDSALFAYQLYPKVSSFNSSQFRRLPRMDIQGSLTGTALYPNQTLYAWSETACQVTCLYASGGCQGYSYVASTSECNLWSSIVQFVPSSIVNSGVLASS